MAEVRGERIDDEHRRADTPAIEHGRARVRGRTERRLGQRGATTVSPFVAVETPSTDRSDDPTRTNTGSSHAQRPIERHDGGGLVRSRPRALLQM